MSTESQKPKPAISLYSGMSLMLAWFYSTWFVPQTFPGVELLSWQVTEAWLVTLAASAVSLFAIPALLGQKRNLSDSRVALYAAPIVLSLAGFAQNMTILPVDGIVYSAVLPVVMGVAASMLWIEWGEYYTGIRASYHIVQVAPTVGAIILASLVISFFVPQPINIMLVELLPLLSGGLLIAARKAGRPTWPTMLPKKERHESMLSILVVCIISLVASAACYFTVAIIPLDNLPYGDYTFTGGALCGAGVLIAIGAISKMFPSKASIFRMFPWLLVMAEISMLLYQSGNTDLYYPSFLIALSISVIFEILLIMYIGILASKGYTKASTAFGFSGGFIWAGVLIGNSIAVSFEHNAAMEDALLAPTTIVLASLLVFLLIPLVRREYKITALTAPVSTTSDLMAQVDAVAKEFGLSVREKEILLYLAKGYTAEGIGRQLTISNFTVQTHIQHIYAKMQIHKRSDLIDYINKRDTESECVEDASNLDALPENWPLSF